MQMKRREIKWAAWGFLGGFLLCCLLIGGLRPEPAAPRVLAGWPGTTVWPPWRTSPSNQLTNLQVPELRIELPPRWEPPPVVMPLGSSLDLIDTHYQAPGDLPDKH